jgi:hypothetical protein
MLILGESMSMKKQTVAKTSVYKATMPSSPAETIWGLDFSEYFPAQITGTIYAEKVSYEVGSELIAKYFPEIYHLDQKSNFSIDSSQTEGGGASLKLSKQKYYEMFADYFVFRDKKGVFAGLGVGTLLDWSSYYFRNMVVVPSFRGKGLYENFFELLCSILKKHHVKRIEGDISPTNRHHLHILNKMGYLVSGMNLTDRWGPLVHVTKFLDAKDEENFGKNFSGTYSSDTVQNKKFKIKLHRG